MAKRLSKHSRASNALSWLWQEYESGRQPLEWVVTRLRKDFPGEHFASEFLNRAVCASDFDATEAAMSLGADVNADPGGQPILHDAIIQGSTSMVALLLLNGASLSRPGVHGLALHVAVAENNEIMVELLLNHGAQVYESDVDDENPLDLARRMELPSMEALLREHAGAELDSN